MKSLSVGVRSVFSEVNCLSKLLTSLRCFWKKYFGKLVCLTVVSVAHNFWFERWLYFAVFNLVPIDSPEKRMDSHVFFAGRSATQSFIRIFRQQLKHQE